MKAIIKKNTSGMYDSASREEKIRNILMKTCTKYNIEEVSEYGIDVLRANYHLIMYEDIEIAAYSCLGFTLLALGMNIKYPLIHIIQSERKKDAQFLIENVIRVIIRVLESKEMADPSEIENLESILADNYDLLIM